MTAIGKPVAALLSRIRAAKSGESKRGRGKAVA